MKKSITKIISLLMAVFMLSLAGCGEKKITDSSGNPVSKPENYNPGVGTSSSNDKDAIKYDFIDTTKGANGKDYADFNPYEGIEKYKGTTVKFATWIDHNSTEGKEPIERFAEEYDINVELVYCSQNNYIEEILALIASNNAPDIFVENGTFPAILQIAQPFSVTGMDLNEPAWDQQILNACTVGKKVYAVNTVNSLWRPQGVVVYNRELMEANGIKTPTEYYEEGNWTWDTMKDVISDVMALGDDYYGANIDQFPFLGSIGAGQVSYDPANAKFKCTITDPKYIEGMQYKAEISKKGMSADRTQFTNGTAALIICDTYGIKSTGYFRSMDPLDLACTYVPSKDANTDTIPSDFLRAYGIVQGAKNPQAAGMFIRYFLDPKNYNIADAFFSVEAAQWYYEALERSYQYSKNNDIYVQYHGLAPLIGESSWDWVTVSGDASQIPTLLSAKVNIVESAIDKAEKLMEKYK